MRRSARLAATTGLVAKCHHAFVDPVLGATRHPTGSVEAASQPTHPAVSHLPAQRIRDGFRRPSGNGKAVPSDRIGQLRDARRSVAQQMHRQDIPKLDPSQLHRLVHRRTVARWSDIEPAVAERRPHRNNGRGDNVTRSSSDHQHRTPLVAQRRAHRHHRLRSYECGQTRRYPSLKSTASGEFHCAIHAH
jgi:hypothetical protein